MSKVNRFIQFNDESVDTKALLLYERLSRALADANYLELTERKLLEFNPTESTLAMSVFWRHRDPEVMHKGRLSDIYLLSAGFWKHFNMPAWHRFTNDYKTHPLRNLAKELVLLFEEFRMTDKIIQQRPGTKHAFGIRQKYYTDFHKTNFQINMQKQFHADSLLNAIFILLYEGLFTPFKLNFGSLAETQLDLIKGVLGNAYESTHTEDNVRLVYKIIGIAEGVITTDLNNQYYSIVDSIAAEKSSFNYHEGMTDIDKGEEEEKETIEEVFRSWHEENEEEQGIHLQYELEHGRSGDASIEDSKSGSEQAKPSQIGFGQSKGDNRKENLDTQNDLDKSKDRVQKQEASTLFGKEHLHVVFEVKKIEEVNEAQNIKKLIQWREEQRPFVRAFVTEIKKRMDVKDNAKSDKLMIGRLSKKLTTLVIDERPKPFYRKNTPSVELDAVFGLLVDGSASMVDKLDETKKAVLLFHDVLRELKIIHEISLYYEDAFEASSTVQPNTFELIHSFSERSNDSGLSILSLDAHEDNRDGFAIRWMMHRLAARQEKHKFLLVFSDGEPSAFGYDRNGVVDTAEAVMEAEKKGISVIHLFLSEVEPSEDQKHLFSMMFGNKTAASSSVESFTDQTLRILRKLLSIVIGQI